VVCAFPSGETPFKKLFCPEPRFIEGLFRISKLRRSWSGHRLRKLQNIELNRLVQEKLLFLDQCKAANGFLEEVFTPLRPMLRDNRGTATI
jgi:hypothetical protein